MATKSKKLAPISPGEMLSEHFIAGHAGLTAYRVALGMGVRPPVVYELISGKRSITAALALRLARYFGNSPQFWINLQSHYDLEVAERKLGARVRKEVTPLAA
jgi:addiction module HigA family antidote